jgi:biotin transporter BioY
VHIAAVGWIYVTLMMAITEETVVAGIMTFFVYGVLPTLIIVYIGGSGQRRKRREQERLRLMQEQQQNAAQKDTARSDEPT